MFRTIVCLCALAQAPFAFAVEPSPGQFSEHAQVAKEACGSNPTAKCLAELRKVCHAHLTFRCYYSRKDRLDAIREVGFPDDRAHHDEE